jgi:DNA-binding CsgD family transcriptional regulator
MSTTPHELRAPFVGRAGELEFLKSALAEATSANGRFVSVAGEAGIGKTRLMAELAEIAKLQGTRVFWSPMIEVPGAPPYFLWIPVLRGCIEQLDGEEKADFLQPMQAELATLLPELRDDMAEKKTAVGSNSPTLRYQLFEAVTRILLSGAKRRTCLILFDNLNIADRSSLSLLAHFGQQLTGSRVLVVAAHRDDDLDRRHPLRGVLNELGRGACQAKLRLKGLQHDEVAELLHRLIEFPATASLVKAIHEQSGGNPLFVTEVGRMLCDQPRKDIVPAPGFHFRVPHSLREVISARLDRLPSQTCELLQTAAVIGREFDIALLAELANLSPPQTVRRLQPAEIRDVISPLGGGRWWFQHALFREVLYSELSSVARAMLHRKAGERIEASRFEDVQEQTAQLAYHFFESAQAVQDHRALQYCRKAAEAATERRAYSEAVALYEQALQLIELKLKKHSHQRFECLMALGRTQYYSGQLNGATKALMKAAILAYNERWWGGLAEALFLFQHLCQQSGLRHVASIPLHREALKHLDRDDLPRRARLHASLAKAYRTAGKPDHAVSAFRQGIELARKAQDDRVLLDCLRKGTWTVGRSPQRVREGLNVSQEALELALSKGPVDAVLDAQTDTAIQLCELGDITALESALAELRTISERERQPHFLSMLAGFETALAILQGRWEEATHLAKIGLNSVPLEGVYGLKGRFAFQAFAIKKARGDLNALSETLARILSGSQRKPLWLPGQILLQYELGQASAARQALVALGDLRKLPLDDLFPISLVYLAEACVGLRDSRRCEVLFSLLEPYRGLNATLPGCLMLGAVAGNLAELAVAVGRLDDAAGYFEEAMEMNASMRAWPALARNKIEWARFLFASRDSRRHAKARKLLSHARILARRYELRPLLDAIEALENATGAEQLTGREIQILNLLARGKSNKHIAAELHISHSTVATHVRNILRKTGANNRTEAADHARRSELIN